MICSRGILILLTVTTVALISFISPIQGKYFSEDVSACLNSITSHIYNDRFAEAEKIIDSISATECCRPLNFLFKTILYQSVMMAAESDSLEVEFHRSLDSVKFYAEEMLVDGRDSVLAYYYLGHQYAFRSLYKGRAGHTWAAIKTGLKARNAYSDGYKLDSGFHDLGLGLGSYRYWKSVKTKAINWTPLFKNEKQNGIELLRRAADSSEISRDASQTSLIWVFINEKRYGEAIRLASEMRKRFPDGMTFLWALGEAYYKLGDCPQALLIYMDLYSRLDRDPGNGYNLIEVGYRVSDCYREIYTDVEERQAKTKELYEKISSHAIPENSRKRQKNRLKELRKRSGLN